MMAPTVVLRDGAPELVLGSAGLEPDPLGDPADDRRASSTTGMRGRRRGARAAGALRGRRRLRRAGHRHRRAARRAGRAIAPFRALNLFFGGVQAVERDAARARSRAAAIRGAAARRVVA